MAKFNRAKMLQEMKAQLQLHLDIAENFKQMSVDHLILKPSPDKWSITQCFQHLNTYGEYYLPRLNSQLGKKWNRNEQADTFYSSIIGNCFVKMMESKTFFKKLKTAKVHLPYRDDDPHITLQTYVKQKQMMLRYISIAKEIDLNKGRIPLSINRFISLSQGDVLRFLIAHDERHLLQINQAVELTST